MYAAVTVLIAAQIILQSLLFYSLPVSWHWLFRVLFILLFMAVLFFVVPFQIAHEYNLHLPAEQQNKKHCGMPVLANTIMVTAVSLLISAIAQLLIVEPLRILLLRTKKIEK